MAIGDFGAGTETREKTKEELNNRAETVNAIDSTMPDNITGNVACMNEA